MTHTDDLKNDTSRDYARQLDAQDDLAHFRQEFVIADEELIYLDGNSLGRLPVAAMERIRHVVEQEWGKDLVTSWGAGWWEAPRRIGDRVAQLVGAAPGQVVVCDSTSINLHKLSLAALSLQNGRSVVLSDRLNFPTDLYILQGAVRLLGDRHTLRLLPSRDGIETDADEILAAIDERTALVVLSHPTFKSGSLYDIEAITRRAHQKGALVLWDVCHGVGVLPLEFDRWEVDFAVGCTYKYLNGGPGAPAFLYVQRDLQDKVTSPITGWWGHESPFRFDLEFTPAQGIERFLAGSAPVLSLLALEPALEVILRAGVAPIRSKSMQLTSYLVRLFDAVLAPLGFSLGSPRQAERRGSHVSIRHPDGYRINRALIEEMKVIPDFREPDNIRLGLAPLYTSFGDVWEGVERIRRVVVEGRHLKYAQERLAIT